MRWLPEDDNPSIPEGPAPSIDFGAIDFPSDALSIRRLRRIFPELFEEGLLKDGYGDFFYPLAPDQPAHLVRLAELLSAERTLADYGFYNAIDPYPSATLDEECHECADDSWKKLVQLYQEFKLADSPETARLLIRQVEEQGAQQGRRIKGRGR